MSKNSYINNDQGSKQFLIVVGFIDVDELYIKFSDQIRGSVEISEINNEIVVNIDIRYPIKLAITSNKILTYLSTSLHYHKKIIINISSQSKIQSMAIRGLSNNVVINGQLCYLSINNKLIHYDSVIINTSSLLKLVINKTSIKNLELYNKSQNTGIYLNGKLLNFLTNQLITKLFCFSLNDNHGNIVDDKNKLEIINLDSTNFNKQAFKLRQHPNLLNF